jgi:hypothetical protein
MVGAFELVFNDYWPVRSHFPRDDIAKKSPTGPSISSN